MSEVLRDDSFVNSTVTVASPRQTSVEEIVRRIEAFFEVSAVFERVESSCSEISPDVTALSSVFSRLSLSFDDLYIDRCLAKYFSHLKNASRIISVVVPTYNEEHGIDEFYRRTKAVLEGLSPRFSHEIIFVNDSSTDRTLEKLQSLALADSSVKVIHFSRNFGNQIGITAGVDAAVGDVVVIIDDDLQDPPEIMINFIAQWDRGYKVVYGVRPKRAGVNPVFRVVAKLYYRVIGSLSEIKIPNDVGDFRLMDSSVIKVLKGCREENRYYRGLVAWVGFPQVGVFYERDRRYAGVSTFSFRKYVNFALNGLTSFTEKPLYFSSLIGGVVTLISFLMAVLLVVSKLIDPSVSIRGWTSLVVIVLFFGGVQMFSVGVLGVYVGKIYREVKRRPLYVVEKTMNIERAKDD